MPNWCNNVAHIRHADKAVIDKIEAAAESGVLQALLPCPQELLDTTAGSFGDEDKQRDLEAREAANFAKYGAKNWYDWCIANWGTKWDLCECTATRNDDNSVTLTFDTAWAPPIDAYETLEGQGFEIEAFYYEPGMAFCGIYENGVADDYEIPGSSDEAAKVIPRAIDEMFNIVGQMEEWEADEA